MRSPTEGLSAEAVGGEGGDAKRCRRRRSARHGADRVILDGTTVEEVERYHARTLKLVVDITNRDRLALAEQQDADDRLRTEQREAHRRTARDIAARLNFD